MRAATTPAEDGYTFDGHRTTGLELPIIDEDALWSCTTCGACVNQCPVDIEHIDHFVDMRRNQVMIATEFPSELNGLFKNLESKGNPWGMNASGRNDWISEVDFDVRVFGMDGEDTIPDDVDYLFWVGCAGAFEDRAKRTTKAVAELLTIAGVQFMVLGEGETCTGDPARRAGNEFLFQMQAMQNVEVLNEIKATKIVVTCPHCLNTLKREYPQLGGNYEVVHHTQLLNDLVKAGRLTPVAPVAADGHLPRSVLPRPPQQRLRPAARAHRGDGRRRLSRWSGTATSPSAAAPAALACGWRRRSARASTRTAATRRSAPVPRRSRWPARSAR